MARGRLGCRKCDTCAVSGRSFTRLSPAVALRCLLSEPRRLGLFGKFLCPQPKLLGRARCGPAASARGIARLGAETAHDPSAPRVVVMRNVRVAQATKSLPPDGHAVSAKTARPSLTCVKNRGPKPWARCDVFRACCSAITRRATPADAFRERRRCLLPRPAPAC